MPHEYLLPPPVYYTQYVEPQLLDHLNYADYEYPVYYLPNYAQLGYEPVKKSKNKQETRKTKDIIMNVGIGASVLVGIILVLLALREVLRNIGAKKQTIAEQSQLLAARANVGK